MEKVTRGGGTEATPSERERLPAPAYNMNDHSHVDYRRASLGVYH